MENNEYKYKKVIEFNEKIDTNNQDAEDIRSYSELFLKHTLNDIETKITDYLKKVCWSEKDIEYFVKAIFQQSK